MLAEAIIRWRKTRDLRRVAQLTRAQLEAEKLAEFRQLVRHAHAHSPYYRRIIAERGIDVASCTPLDFPVLTKSLLMRHFDEIVTAPGVTKSGDRGVSDPLARSRRAFSRPLSRDSHVGLLGRGRVFRLFEPRLGTRHGHARARCAPRAQRRRQRQVPPGLLRRRRRPLCGRHLDQLIHDRSREAIRRRQSSSRSTIRCRRSSSGSTSSSPKC